MIFSTRISELQGQLDQANSNLTAVTTERDQLKTDLATVTGERDQAKTDLTTVTGERDQLKTDLATLTGERDQLAAKIADLEKGTEREVTKRIAAAGVPAVARVDNPSDDEPKSDSGKGRTATTWGRDFSKK